MITDAYFPRAIRDEARQSRAAGSTDYFHCNRHPSSIGASTSNAAMRSRPRLPSLSGFGPYGRAARPALPFSPCASSPPSPLSECSQPY